MEKCGPCLPTLLFVHIVLVFHVNVNLLLHFPTVNLALPGVVEKLVCQTKIIVD